MKSFGKTFRAILALSMALCMVMSCVTVSADAVTLEQVSVGTTPDTNGYYEVKYKVSGISAENGNATILVHSGAAPTNETIEYANQMPVTDGEATFTMLVDNGNYAVLAGGTGFATAAYGTTLRVGSAPTIEATPVSGVKDNATSENVATFTVRDADGVANVTSVALSGEGSENFVVNYTPGTDAGAVEVAENASLSAITYALTLTVTDAEGKTGTCPVSITIDPSVITVAEYKTSLNGDLDWNQTLTYPEATEYVNINGVSYKDEWSTEDNATYKNTVVLPSGYQFSADVTEMEVSYTVNKIDSRPEVTFEYDGEISLGYADEYTDPTVTAVYYEEGVKKVVENVAVAYDGDEVNTRVVAETTYNRKAYVTLPEGYRVTGTNGVETSLSITITVNDDRIPVDIRLPEDANPLKVSYGTKADEIVFPELIYVKSDSAEEYPVIEGLKVNTADWVAVGEFDPKNTTDKQMFMSTLTLVDSDDYKFVPENKNSVEVYLQVLVEDNRETITAVEYVDAVIEVTYGTNYDDITFPEVTFAGEYADVKVELSDWTCEKEYDPEKPDTYVFTATVVNDDTNAYKFNVEPISVTVKVAKKDIIVTGYKYEKTEAFNYGEVGDYTLPEQVEVEAEDYVGKFNVTWDNEFSQAAGTVVYTGTVAVPTDDAVYNFDAKDAAAPVITVTITYVVDGYEFLDAEGNEVDTVYVEPASDFELAVEAGLFPVKVALYDGDALVGEYEAQWIEPEDGTFPAAEWESVDILLYKDAITLVNATWDVVPKIAAVTMGEANFALKVDGYEKKYVASLSDKVATVTIDPVAGDAIEGIADGAAYKFDIDGVAGAWQEANAVEVVPVPGTSTHTVVATIKLADGSEVSKTVYINKYSTLFGGSVYVNATEANPTYSATRANKNREITVTYDYNYANDNGYDFANGTATLVVYNAGAEVYSKEFVKGEKTITIPANTLNDNASYRFTVTYVADNENVGSKFNARYSYVSSEGTWYNSFLVNGLSRSGIVIRNTDSLTNKIQFTDLGADGKAWIAHALKKYNDDAVVFEDDYSEIVSADYEYSKSLSKAEYPDNASYKFYTTLKLDDANQAYNDMSVSRVVYIYNQVSAVTNFAVNGSCKAGPVVADGKYEIKPYWYQDARRDGFAYETITYTLTFEGVTVDDLTDFVDGGTVEGNTVTFAEYKGDDTAPSIFVSEEAFGKRVKATLVVEIDGVVDTTVSRVFWPQAQ